ncbi:MAG: GNAT family N-acetyltransferase [Kiritimatiellae bacterium]|nr:GNAT family N-acetyltransferase [Kiritimatiellia bacterium]
MITIREGRPEDLLEIVKLDGELMEFDRTFDATLDLDWPNSESARAFYTDRLARREGIALLAEDGGRVIGYLLGCLESTAEYSVPETAAVIECLFVRPSSRGQGVGRQLVERFEEWARASGAHRLRVAVSAANRGALRFYRRQGFRLFDVVLDKLIGGGRPAGSGG